MLLMSQGQCATRATAALCGIGKSIIIMGPTEVNKNSRVIALAKRSGGITSDSMHVSVIRMLTDFGNLKLKTAQRIVKLRAERDPFAEFSAAFIEEEEEVEAGNVGMTDAERDAIIAFETGGVGAAVAEEDDEEGEDLWLEKDAKDRRVDLPKPKRGKGGVIGDILTVFLGLLERPFGSDGRVIAAAGGTVMERVKEEVEKLRGADGVEEQFLFEILRVVRLIEMDLQLVSASRKDQTFMERLMQTAVHTRQALDIANSL